MDIPMNEHGIRQMEAVGSWLHEHEVKMDLIVSSPLGRARMSAEIVATKTGYPGV